MRLNGTYLDRLIFGIMPVMFLSMLFIYFFNQPSSKTLFVTGLICTLLFWLGDSYVVYRRRPKSLHLDHDLFIDGIKVSDNEIVDIRKITYKPGRFWTWDYFTFTVQRGGKMENINILERPHTLIHILMGKESKTLKLLFERFPGLKAKYTHHTTIHSLR